MQYLVAGDIVPKCVVAAAETAEQELIVDEETDLLLDGLADMLDARTLQACTLV
jgi:hypothetical protein